MNRTHRSNGMFRLQAAAVAALALVGARSAQAQWGRSTQQQQGAQLLFEWQGNVDRETQFDLYANSRDVNVHGVSSQESRGRFVSRNQMPNAYGTLYVERISGRGNVDVIRQPSNGGGVVRIQDPSGGQGYYDIRVYWQPSGTVGSNYPSNGYPDNRYPNAGYPSGNYPSSNGTYDRNDRNNDAAARDRSGNVIRDRRGNVVRERRGNAILVRDRYGNAVFDRNGNPVYEKTNNGRRGRGDRDER